MLVKLVNESMIICLTNLTASSYIMIMFLSARTIANKLITLMVISVWLLSESDDGAAFIVYYRWGRVGVRGQDKLQGPYTSRDTAINEFVQKFYAKTGNHWFNRKEFICYPKYYTWLEMDYGGKEEQEVSVCIQKHSVLSATLIWSSEFAGQGGNKMIKEFLISTSHLIFSTYSKNAITVLRSLLNLLLLQINCANQNLSPVLQSFSLSYAISVWWNSKWWK